MNKSKILLVLLLSILLIVTGCSSSSEEGVSSGTNNTIKIGVSVVRTGGSAEGGENIYQGVQIATDMFNEQGGINGRQIELVVRDHEGDPTKGISTIREFASDDVIAGIGGYYSTVMLAQTPIIKSEEIPYIVATSNVPASVEDGMPWTFGVRMNANTTAKYALEYIEKNFNTNKIAILHEDGGYGKGAVDAMTLALKEEGLEPVAVEAFNQSDQDMTAQVTRARAAGAEAIYLFGIGAPNGYVLSAMKKIGWDVPVIGEMGMSQTSVPEIAGEVANGTYAIQTANYGMQDLNEVTQEFLTRAKEKFGAIPTMPAPSAQGFDGAMLLFKALEKIELTGDIKNDRVALKDALENEDLSYDGIVKSYGKTFSADNHDALGNDSYLMNVWQDGVLIPAEIQ